MKLRNWKKRKHASCYWSSCYTCHDYIKSKWDCEANADKKIAGAAYRWTYITLTIQGAHYKCYAMLMGQQSSWESYYKSNESAAEHF